MADGSRNPGESRTSGTGVVTDKKSSLRVSETTRWLLRLITAAGLAVDAYVHWHLAPTFDTLTGSGSPHISQGQLFRLEAVLALIAMLLVLVTRHRVGAAFALLTAAGGLSAVLLYAFVQVGALGPLPDMSDPTWSAEKTISAVAEAIAAVGALLLLLLPQDERTQISSAAE
jgi:hypothetical protein